MRIPASEPLPRGSDPQREERHPGGRQPCSTPPFAGRPRRTGRQSSGSIVAPRPRPGDRHVLTPPVNAPRRRTRVSDCRTWARCCTAMAMSRSPPVTSMFADVPCDPAPNIAEAGSWDSGIAADGRGGRAPRPRLRPGAARGSLSSNGRPGTRQGVRTPHLRAAMPVDAYSLAVSCGGRGVSCDIWPASLSARAAPRAALSRARRGSPRPARCVAPRSIRRHAGFPAHCAFPRHAAFLAVGGAAPIRALPRIWRTVPCDASTAYAAALQHGTGSSPLGDAVTPGSSVPATSHMATN